MVILCFLIHANSNCLTRSDKAFGNRLVLKQEYPLFQIYLLSSLFFGQNVSTLL